MGYLSRLGSALIGRDAKARSGRPSSAPRQGWADGRGVMRYLPGAEFNYAKAVGDRRRNGVVSVCVRFLTVQMLQAELKVGTRNDEGVYAESPEWMPLARKFQTRPNPFASGRQFWAGVVADYLVGNAYAYVARVQSALPDELYWRPAERMTVHTTEDPDRPVEAYRFHDYSGNPLELYDPADVIHFRAESDPDNPVMGVGRLQDQDRSIAALNEGERHTGAVLRNGHAGKLLHPKGTAADAEDEAGWLGILASIKKMLGGDRAGGIGAVPIEAGLLDLGLGPEEMGLDAILDRPETMVVASLGLNALALGLKSSDATRTFANYGEARKAAWEEGVIPLQDALAEHLTAFLAPELGEGLEFWWDRTKVAALGEDADARATRAATLFQAALLPRDRCLEEAELEPVGAPDGDLYYGEATATQRELAREFGGQGGEGEPSDEPPDDADPFDDPFGDGEPVKAIRLGSGAGRRGTAPRAEHAERLRKQRTHGARAERLGGGPKAPRDGDKDGKVRDGTADEAPAPDRPDAELAPRHATAKAAIEAEARAGKFDAEVTVGPPRTKFEEAALRASRKAAEKSKAAGKSGTREVVVVERVPHVERVETPDLVEYRVGGGASFRAEKVEGEWRVALRGDGSLTTAQRLPSQAARPADRRADHDVYTTRAEAVAAADFWGRDVLRSARTREAVRVKDLAEFDAARYLDRDHKHRIRILTDG